jgi:hypothetical protein
MSELRINTPVACMQVKALQHGLEQLQVSDRHLDRLLRKQLQAAAHHVPALMAVANQHLDARDQHRYGNDTGTCHDVSDLDRPMDLEPDLWHMFKSWLCTKMTSEDKIAAAELELNQHKVLMNHITDNLQKYGASVVVCS